MEFNFSIGGDNYAFDSKSARSIAIELRFGGRQPQHFGADAAVTRPMTANGFTGDTAAGGSCNVDIMTINPHCNGTHTETISHIVDDKIAIGSAATKGVFLSQLVSIEPVAADSVADSYDPPLQSADRVINRSSLEKAFADQPPLKIDALIVRTMPNPTTKQTCKYGMDLTPAFFTSQAMDLILELGVQHLLVDLPSVDRMNDDGQLSNHHRFWNVEPGAKRIVDASWPEKTITEMIFVPDEIRDGLYLLNLQVAPFASDVSPSRPILYPLTHYDDSKF